MCQGQGHFAVNIDRLLPDCLRAAVAVPENPERHSPFHHNTAHSTALDRALYCRWDACDDPNLGRR